MPRKAEWHPSKNQDITSLVNLSHHLLLVNLFQLFLWPPIIIVCPLNVGKNARCILMKFFKGEKKKTSMNFFFLFKKFFFFITFIILEFKNKNINFYLF